MSDPHGLTCLFGCSYLHLLLVCLWLFFCSFVLFFASFFEFFRFGLLFFNLVFVVLDPLYVFPPNQKKRKSHDRRRSTPPTTVTTLTAFQARSPSSTVKHTKTPSHDNGYTPTSKKARNHHKSIVFPSLLFSVFQVVLDY